MEWRNFFRVPKGNKTQEVVEQTKSDIKDVFETTKDKVPKNRGKKNSKARRKVALKVSGNDEAPSVQNMKSIWSEDGTEFIVPREVGKKLEGKTMSYNRLRQEIYKTTAELAGTLLTKREMRLLKGGAAPYAPKKGRSGKRKKMEIDHIIEIQHGGHPTHLKNMRIITPKDHVEKHASDQTYTNIKDITG